MVFTFLLFIEIILFVFDVVFKTMKYLPYEKIRLHYMPLSSAVR